jgi:tRNA pseudouridine13 synthase
LLLLDALPFLTADLAPIGGVLRATPEDFRVEEIPAYEPSGEGPHLYVTFEKRGMTTPDAVRAMARALGVDPREAGWAGLKDRHAVTVQTASFLEGDATRALALELPGVRVLAARRHRNKLKTGHLHGNRFVITVRGCVQGAGAVAEQVRARLLAIGAPNYYGGQRFGREGDNAARGRAWLSGQAPAPREPFLRKMFVSALQSELFNQYVAARLTDGLLDRYLDGDLALRHPVGGPFLIEPAEAEECYAARRCSASGPMFGRTMKWPEREARAREERVLAEAGLTLEHFARARDLAEGTRRAVRLVFDEIEVRETPGTEPGTTDVVLGFTLPAGGYATAVLREFRKTDDEGLQSEAASGIEAPAPPASAVE